MTSLVPRPGALVAPQLDYFLIDGSGSMQGKWWDSMAAIEAFTDVLKTSNVNSHGILTVFDSADLALVQRDGLIGEWPAMQVSPLAAHWGGTPSTYWAAS
jgi:hypothetical protein